MFNLLAVPTYFTVVGINISLVDIVALVVLLIFMIVGISQGFMKQVLSLLGVIAAIVVAVALAKPVTSLIIDKFPDFFTSIKDKCASLFGENLNVSKEELPEALKSSNIPAFLHGLIIKISNGESGNVISYISGKLATWILTGGCFVALFVVSLILFAIIKGIFKKITQVKAINKIDRFLGAILSLVKGLILLVIVSLILSLIPALNMNYYFTPTTSSGKTIMCVFSVVVDFILNLPFIVNLF